MSIDVLIVGAGPTGLMLANQLARRGIRPVIIDRHSGPAQQSRAMAVHARTLEIYAKLGIASRAVELGEQGNGANVWVSGKLKARIPLEEMGKSLSAFPYVLMLGQDENERIMGERLRDWGVDVEWNTADRTRATRGPVTATTRQPDGSRRTIDAADVAGCDGGRSRRASDERHRLSGRRIRTLVLRRGYGGDGTDGAERTQRLLVAQGVPSVLPDARSQPLASDRAPAGRAAVEARCDVRRTDAVTSAEGAATVARR